MITPQQFKTLTTQSNTDYTVQTEFLSDEIDLMIDIIEENAGVFDSESWTIAQSILHKLIQPLRSTSSQGVHLEAQQGDRPLMITSVQTNAYVGWDSRHAWWDLRSRYWWSGDDAPRHARWHRKRRSSAWLTWITLKSSKFGIAKHQTISLSSVNSTMKCLVGRVIFPTQHLQPHHHSSPTIDAVSDHRHFIRLFTWWLRLDSQRSTWNRRNAAPFLHR